MPDLTRLPAAAPQHQTGQPSFDGPASAIERIWHDVSLRHQDYLQTTAAAHAAYLNAAASLLGGAAMPPAQTAPVALPPPRPAPAPASVPAPVAPVSPPQPAVNTPPPAAPAPVRSAPPVNVAPMPAMPRPGPAAPPAAQATKPAGSADPIALVRSIISEKTGYPEDMLEPDMDLEGELGVDSIKQVEILSTLRDRMPELPEIEPEKLVELRTIAAIAAMISQGAGETVPATAPIAAAPQPAPPAASSGEGSGVTADVVRSLIAEKTGYPTDMLEDDMDLEGELGVDSIKQVEILSALRDRFPSLPEVDPEDIAELRSIRKIADFFA